MLDLSELWRYRELFFFFAWRDIKVRYKQTAFGALWAILQPVASMAIFSLFFGRLAGMPSDGAPYPLFALAGLVPWTYFSNALTRGGESLVRSQSLVTKVYFPRVALPLSSTVVPLVDLFVSSAVLCIALAWYGTAPGLAMLTLPLWALMAASAAFGASLWLSALNVSYRDVRQALPFLVQIWMYASPIVYPTSLVPERWRPYYALNPLVTVMEGFRQGTLGTSSLTGAMVLASATSCAVLVLSGAWYFRRSERSFADVI